MCVLFFLRGSNPLVSLKFSSTDRPTYHGRLELGCPKRAWGFSGPKTPLASTVHHLGRFLVLPSSRFACFRRSSPRRDLAAGRDGVRRRHAAVDPIDAGPPRALADHQPRSVTISATASSSSSSLLILFSGAQINALLLGEPCTSWVVVSPLIFRFWEGFGL